MAETDLISRQAALDAIRPLQTYKLSEDDNMLLVDKAEVQTELMMLPSAQPETDGFCTDCKEYDSERHFCPRFDRVIKKTVEEIGIVHCKDCKYYVYGDDEGENYCRNSGIGESENFFCADAERRGNEAD